ncbi:hypothetical protein BCR34DRAFT_551521 [Clohesyomyces aquaticus]|uniref:F-box domain-containing protein n=1 Tax=Clohesyomyces aquaticus TaxID=1231657 RepID=A0A1Y2ABN6_9PLEO|nr:hypothetical protein BCR34DRAFT_551521 [Clohesyomyces aquaticus]
MLPRFSRLAVYENPEVDKMAGVAMGVATAWLLHNLELLQKSAEKDHHPQTQSPLFGKLPAEIRNEIFALTVTEDEDLSKPYGRQTYYWRPEFRGPRRFNVALLRTCKRIWLETRPLPHKLLRNLPWAFFLAEENRRPPEYRDKGPRQLERAQKFLTTQWQALETIQIFLQGLTKGNIEGFFREPLLQPSTIIFTIRYTDWLYWESQYRLGLDSRQMRWTRLPDTVTKVVMEFEIIQSREQELNNLIAELTRLEERYRWYRRDRKSLRILNSKKPCVKEWTWDGPTNYGDGRTWQHHPSGYKMTYVVKVVEWERDEA